MKSNLFTMFLRVLFFILIVIVTKPLTAQVLFNEVLSLNTSGITDEDNENTDWIELYNASDLAVDLAGFSLKDNLNDSIPWVFPSIEMKPKSHLLIYASGKDRKIISLNYKTVIKKGDEWQYVVPPSSLANGKWREPGFDASGWQKGKSGFGYGDNDDETIIQPLTSLFIRKTFQIDDVAAVQKIILHMDYDDGFVALINGVQVAIENASVPNGIDFNNATTNGGGHEAAMYNGGSPTAYVVDLKNVPLFKGENVIAVQGYNTNAGSSDFSLLPFLTIGSTNYAFNDVENFVSIEKGGLHTNFKIKNEGESLYLFDKNQNLIDSVRVVELAENVSYGRFEDGQNSWFYFPEPTPGTTNLNPMEELRNDTIIFSRDGGFYNQSISLGISSNEGIAIIKYTTDGSEPNSQSSNYAGGITIDKTTVIRAAAFFSGVISGPVYTQTYFINTQHKLPVLSISTHPDNFWDYNTGILVEGPNAQSGSPKYGANYWEDWEKIVNVEFYDENGNIHVNQGAGIKVSGAWSRMHDQKSMALFARSKYGKGSFKHQFFHDRSYDAFEALLLRNGGNDWPLALIRDGLASEIAKDFNMERLAFQPAVIYLSGRYWGILNMRDKPNEHFFASLYNIDSDNINILEGEGFANTGENFKYSSMIGFIQNNDLKTDIDYQAVTKVMDASCFIDYQLFQIYLNNRDWPGNNIKFWNTNSLHSKYRWLLYDTEFGMNLYGDTEYTENGIQFAAQSNGPGWPNPPWSTLLLRKMLTNEGFKIQFVNRMADMMNMYLLPDVMNSKLDSIVALVSSEMPDHQRLWGRSFAQWQDNLSPIYTFNDKRSDYVRNHFLNYFGFAKECNVTLTVSNAEGGQIMVSSITPNQYPFKGIYFSDVPITFSAKPKPGYQFVRWENASSSTKPKIELTLNGNITLNAVFEKVSTNNFQVVINEISYYSADDYDSGDWLELYNDGLQTIDLAGWIISGTDAAQNFIFPAGTILYPNEYLIVYNNEKKFNETYPTLQNKVGTIPFGFSRKGDVIYLYDSKNNLIDMVAYETFSPWPEEPNSSSATIELKNPSFDNNLSGSWGIGPIGGTPGEANSIRTSINQFKIETFEASCFPTKFSDYTTLRFNSPGEGSYKVQILDMQGRLHQTLKGEMQIAGTHYLDIFTESERYKAGIYLVKLETNLGAQMIKVVKY